MGPTLALLLLASATADAAAWTQEAGAHYAKLWTRSLVGKGIFAADGSRTPLGGWFTDVNVQAYGELGLTDHLTAVAALTPLGIASHGGDTSAYLGPSMAGLRAGGALGSLRAAGELRLGGTPPVGDRPLGGIAVTENGPYTYQPALAAARIEGEAQLGGPLRFGWWVVAPGLRWQSAEELSLAVLTFAQLGWSISERWTTDLHLSILEPLQPASAPAVVNGSGAGWTRYQGFGAAGSWWLRPELGLQFGIEGVVTAMANAETPTLVLGVEHRSR
jgi:hypothetical protein